MAIDVTAKKQINHAAAGVAAYAFEPANDPKWIGGITVANLLTERPVQKGTQVQRLAGFMGKTIDYILEVIELTEGHKMVMKSVKSPFPMVVTYQFDDLGNGQTLASVRVQGTAQGWYRIADFLMAPMVKKNLNRDLRNLKSIMEGNSNF